MMEDAPMEYAATEEKTDSRKPILKGLIEAGASGRKDFMDMGKKVSQYAYDKNHLFEYQDTFAADPKQFHHSRVSKMAQAVEVFGTYLYPQNPTRRVEPREWASDISRMRTDVMSKMLNYLPGENNLYGNSRKAIDDALIYGRGVLWTGWDERKNVVTSIFDSVENLLVDPDAYSWDQANWVARLRNMPRWQALKRYATESSKVRDLIMRQEAVKKPSDDAMQYTERDPMADMICLYEVYARIGLHNYKGGSNLVEQPAPDGGLVLGEADDSPLKYVITKDGDIIKECPWEVPYFHDSEWPCTVLDLRDNPKSVWPHSILFNGVGHCSAMNWIYTLYLTKIRFTSRTLLAVLKGGVNGGIATESLADALYGGEFPVLELEAVAGEVAPKISDYIQQLNFNSGVEEFERCYGIAGREFEMATGLFDVLQFGEGGKQDRSAEATKFRKETSTTRITDWVERVERWQGAVARKEAIAVRFLMGPEDVAPILGEEQAMIFGELMDPEQDFLAMFRESEFTIESGSMQRKTPEMAINAASEAMNQVVPALMQAGQIGPALSIIGAWAKLNQMPESVMESLNAAIGVLNAPPPPPMPMMPGMDPAQASAIAMPQEPGMMPPADPMSSPLAQFL